MMRATTLKASSAGLDGLIAYYAGLAAGQAERDGVARGPVDYYLDRSEPPGRWRGSACAALGLGGEVRADQLEALLTARHPVAGTRLGRGFGDRSARAFDATFSAPKSVSVLWAVSPDPFIRAEVLAAHDAATGAALDWFERHGALTRRGTNGVDQVDTQGLAVAVFRQHTSRPADPQLHSHAIVTSKVQDPTGRLLALDARFLKRQQRSIGWVYASALRAELSARLGVAWGPVVEGHGDIAGVPEALLKEFSKRTEQVEARLAELVAAWVEAHDGAEPGPRTLWRLERRAVLDSRPAKEPVGDAEVLRAEWRRRAAAAGTDALELPTFPARSGTVLLDREAVIDQALARLAADSATWLTADLAREIATLVPAGAAATAVELVVLVDELAAEAAGRCVELHPPAPVSVRRRRTAVRSPSTWSPALIRQWYAALVANHSPSVAAKAYTRLRQILTAALNDEVITKNPCRIERGSVEHSPEQRFATMAELAALAGAIPDRYRALVLSAGLGGLRQGELFALRWRDVDLAAATIAVRRKRLRLASGEVIEDDPKSRAGRRAVALPAVLVAELERHRVRHACDAGPDDYVFFSEEGTPLERSNFRQRVWLPAAKAAGLAGMRFHDLRHTAGTLAARTGATTKELMARLGHASPRAAMI